MKAKPDLVSPEAFESMVAEEIDRVPRDWVGRLKNVAFLIEEESPKDMPELLGLYQGVPLTERGDGEGLVMPDTITLYRTPILRAAEEDGIDPRIVVRETLWHEIGHYFGLDEEEVHAREEEGTNRFGQ